MEEITESLKKSNLEASLISSRGVSIKLGSGCSTHSAILNSFSARRFRSLPPYFLLTCFPRAFTILNRYIQSYTLFLIRKLESAWERGYCFTTCPLPCWFILLISIQFLHLFSRSVLSLGEPANFLHWTKHN